MPTSFISLSDQIELNERRLAFEYERYESYNSRFTLISIIYSVIAIYFVQLLQFTWSDRNHIKAVFIAVLLFLIVCIIWSLWHSISLVWPRDVSYLKLPKEFYEKVRKEYEGKGITEEEEVNEYLRASYNDHLEVAVAKNSTLCYIKSQHYFRAFQLALTALIPYLICLSIYLATPKEDTQTISLKNYREITNYQDSLSLERGIKNNISRFDSSNSTGK